MSIMIYKYVEVSSFTPFANVSSLLGVGMLKAFLNTLVSIKFNEYKSYQLQNIAGFLRMQNAMTYC